MYSHRKSAPLLALALAMLAPAAHAMILDIDAQVDTPQTVTLPAGTYDIAIIDNTASGGYAGWTYAYGSGVREVFDVTIGGAQTVAIDKQIGSSTSYQSYASSALALAAFQTGPYIVTNYGGSADGATVDVLPTLQFFLPTQTQLLFSTPDYLRIDNTGGVSMSITQAVPEPQSVALILAGLGVAVVSMRRRRST